MRDTRGFRLALLGALYFAQGVPFGLINVTLALHLARAGSGAPELATLSWWATMPWTLKFLIGPVVDARAARGGRRRWLIAGAELTMAASLVSLAFVDAVHQRSAFLALVFAHNVCAAFQDVATDGLAIAILPEHERGSANGVMSAAKFAGVFAGGAVLARVDVAWGWTSTVALAMAFTVTPALMLIGVREPKGGIAPARLLHELREAFRPRATWLAVPFALLSCAPDALLSPLMFPLMLNQLALSDDRINDLVTLSTFVQALASLGGGILADRFGRRATVIAATVLSAISYAAFAAAHADWKAPGVLLSFSIASAIATGVLYSATLALFMDLTDLAVGATQFQIYMALTNVSLASAPKIGAALSQRLPTAALFAVAGAVAVAALVVLPRGGPRPRAPADAQ